MVQIRVFSEILEKVKNLWECNQISTVFVKIEKNIKIKTVKEIKPIISMGIKNIHNRQILILPGT